MTTLTLPARPPFNFNSVVKSHGWVELAPFRYGNANPTNLPGIWEAQTATLKVPGTGMAVTVDIANVKDIHPKNKQEVGKRLALWARGAVYGQEVATSGPLPAGHEVRGSEIALRFQHTDGGLVAKGGELRGFVIAGADKQWKPAQARIQGELVIVSHPEIPRPIAVRYAWENNPACNLYNGAGLPASPFRTDDFPAAEETN